MCCGRLRVFPPCGAVSYIPDSPCAPCNPVGASLHSLSEPHGLRLKSKGRTKWLRSTTGMLVASARVTSARRVRGGARTDVAVDAGLRAYMLRVYNYMAAGIALTGIVAYVIFSNAVTTDPALAVTAGGQAIPLHRGMFLTQFGYTVFASPLKWVLMFAPLAFVFFLSWRIYKMSVGAAQLSFWLFAAVMGASLSWIFLVFTGNSITQVFFITAAAFGGLSLYGYNTRGGL